MAALSNFSTLLTPDAKEPVPMELWHLFEKLFHSVAGFYPEDFRFIVGSTPFSTLTETTIMIFTYYVVILGGREIMKPQKPLKLQLLFTSYNLCLTLISATLLALSVEELLPRLLKNGIFHTICTWEGGWSNRMVTLYYVCIPNTAQFVLGF
jgi:fatty acid elongase 3